MKVQVQKKEKMKNNEHMKAHVLKKRRNNDSHVSK